MKKLSIGLSFWVFLGVTLSAQPQTKLFVSPSGNDSYPGTIEKPFATLEQARAMVRAKRKKHGGNTVMVYLRKGRYTMKNSFLLDSLDSGSEQAPVIYAAYPNEEVSINGSVFVPVKKATSITEAKILSRLVPEAKHKILQINLWALGIKNYGAIKPYGFGRPYVPTAMELFCNGKAMMLSRWPNDSTVKTGKVLDAGSVPRDGDTTNRGGKFKFEETRPQRWTEAKDIWISGFFKYGYADDAVRIATLDIEDHTITTQHPHIYGFGSGQVFHRWFAYNLLEEIDQPGEYYIDRDKGILYFYPPENALNSIELSVLESPLVSMKDASHIRFSNIIFEGSRGMGLYIEGGTSNTIENCVFRNLGLLGIMVGKGIAPFKNLQHAGTGEPASAVVGNLYSHLYDNTTMKRHAGTNHLITGCVIYNTGSGGVILGGGDRLTLEKGNNRVEHCRIHDFNRIVRSYKGGVNIDGVGNIIRNNEIYNCPGSAILLHGNDHLIEQNNIHHAVTDGDDMGAIYYGRDPGEFGNKVHNNSFHHLGNDHGLLVAVYHDDGACGMEVFGNVFYKAGSRASLIGGGNDNVYRNNLFVDCEVAFHIDNRLQGWASNMVKSNEIFDKRLKAVNYKQPPYSTAYPTLLNYFEDNTGLPKRNYIESNVFVNTKMITNGKAAWTNIGKNLTLYGNPGFVDFEKMNFELLPSSEIFKLLPEFEKIPFNEIGINKKVL